MAASWRNLAADVDPSVLGDVVLHSIRVRKTGVPCVTSTALTPVGFSSPNGAVAAGGEEVVLGVGDQSSGMLGRVAEHTDEATSEVVSRSAGAWLDGGAEGDSADAYTAVTLVSGATPNRVVAVAVGSYESRTAPRFAGVEVAPAPMSAVPNGGQAADARRPAVTDVYEFVSDSPLGGGNYGQVWAGCIQSRCILAHMIAHAMCARRPGAGRH